MYSFDSFFVIHIKYVNFLPLFISRIEFLPLKMSDLRYPKEGVFLRHPVCPYHSGEGGGSEFIEIVPISTVPTSLGREGVL